MEIEITRLIGSEDFVPFDLSNNESTLGTDCARLTWNAATEAARDIAPPILATEKELQAMRDWAESSGGWDDDEIAAWSDEELRALFLQLIAGDIREAFHDAEPAAWDWADYEKRAERGSISGCLYKTDDGRIFYYLGS